MVTAPPHHEASGASSASVYAAWKAGKDLDEDHRQFLRKQNFLCVISLGLTGKPQRVSTKALKLDSNLVHYKGPKAQLSIRAPHCSIAVHYKGPTLLLILTFQRIIAPHFNEPQLQAPFHFFYIHQIGGRPQLSIFLNASKILKTLVKFCYKKCNDRKTFLPFSRMINLWKS